MEEELRNLLRIAFEVVKEKYPDMDYLSMSIVELKDLDKFGYSITALTNKEKNISENGELTDGKLVPYPPIIL